MSPWWQTAVVYQIYPRSFADTDGDGIGDLAGVREHLDHLVTLGVDALWLSPFFPSPMADFGYDVSDYCDVDPVFGDLAAFDELVTEAHARDLKVMVDWVPNHSSDRHPWFVASRSGRDDPHRDWYVWRDSAPGTAPFGGKGAPPNNWIRSWSDQPAWTFDEASGQWYLHLFLPEQPDLNWADPELEAAMQDTLRFWLDRGVDGFRMDVIHCIGKDPALPDDPPELAPLGHVPFNDVPETHRLLRGIRAVLDEYPGERTSVGEVYLLDLDRVAKYYGDGDELHLSFNFLPLHMPWRAGDWRRVIADVEAKLGPIGAWPTWVLSNHDVIRQRTRLGSDARARAAAVLLLTLRGTPFLYAGEELGLEDAVIPPDRVVDVGGRDGCRAPFPWTADPDHGWPGNDPWLPWPPDPGAVNAASAWDDPASMVHLYQRLLRLRRATPALHEGSIELIDAPVDVLAYRRSAGDDDGDGDGDGDERLVVVNFAPQPVELGALGALGARRERVRDGWLIELASAGSSDGEPFTGVVPGDAAVVLRPR